jgi:hypothetical protein
MLKSRRELDLALEPLRRKARSEIGRQHLDHDASPEARLLGEEDARHAPAAELALDGVGCTKRRLESSADVGYVGLEMLGRRGG